MPEPVATAAGHGPLRVAPLLRDAVRVTGGDAVSFLHGQLSQDVEGLAVGGSAWSFLLQPQGKVDAWLRVSRLTDDELVLDVDAGWGDAVVARLNRFRLRVDAEVALVDGVSGLALRGPGADTVTLRPAEGLHAFVAPARWPGLDGVDVLAVGRPVTLDDVVVPDGIDVGEIGPDGLEAIRIACGVPRMGAELTEATIPAEVGQWVIDASVSFAKGCYVGQELVARIDARGGNVPRRLRGVRVPGAAAVGDVVLVEGDEVGALTSVAPGGSPVTALALVKRAVEPPAAARLRSATGEQVVEIVEVPSAGS